MKLKSIRLSNRLRKCSCGMSDSNVTHNIFCCTPSLRVIIPTSPPLLFLQYTICVAAMRNFVNRADMLHFEEEVTDEGMSFDYRVRPGRTLTRNAIRLLRLMGLDESITQRADKRARRFLETGIWEKGEI